MRHTYGNSDKTNHLELNQVLPYCLNSSVQRRFYPKCEVFKTGSCGYGLKVCVDVTCGTVMMEYTGEVITSTECSDRMRGMKGMTLCTVTIDKLFLITYSTLLSLKHDRT